MTGCQIPVANIPAPPITDIPNAPVFGLYSDVAPIMVWGGIKGGISVALALSLPETEWKPLILTTTYVVVVFSIIVQGLTVAPLARRVGREPELM